MKTEIKINDKIPHNLKKTNLIVRIVCANVIFFLLLFSFVTLGWFMNNDFSETNSVKLSSDNEFYELASAGEQGKYDSYLNAKYGTEISINDINNDILELSSTDENEIIWKMSQDSNIGNYGSSDGIQPGSSGRLTFYVVAKKDCKLNISFSLDTILYNSDIKNNNSIISDNIITNFIKGHILFFEEYDETNQIYSERIFKAFNYSQDVLKDTAYPINIYWVWPNVVDQLILPENDRLLAENKVKRLIANDDDTFEKDMSTNNNYYFLSADNNFNFDDVINNLKNGSVNNDFDKNSYEVLNEMWNNADGKIGTEVAYIELKITGFRYENE